MISRKAEIDSHDLHAQVLFLYLVDTWSTYSIYQLSLNATVESARASTARLPSGGRSARSCGHSDGRASNRRRGMRSLAVGGRPARPDAAGARQRFRGPPEADSPSRAAPSPAKSSKDDDRSDVTNGGWRSASLLRRADRECELSGQADVSSGRRGRTTVAGPFVAIDPREFSASVPVRSWWRGVACLVGIWFRSCGVGQLIRDSSIVEAERFLHSGIDTRRLFPKDSPPHRSRQPMQDLP